MQTLRELIRYGDETNARVLTSAAKLDDGALDTPLGIGPGSVREIAQHLVAGEVTWLDRLSGEVEAAWVQSELSSDPVELAELLREVQQRRDQLLDGASIDRLEARLSYRDSKGGLFTATLHEMLLQYVLHSHHHRAQIANALRRVGGDQLDLDYMHTVRQTADA